VPRRSSLIAPVAFVLTACGFGAVTIDDNVRAQLATHEQKMSKLREQLTALEKRLAAKEAELASYVAQAQSTLHQREADWWKKVLGPEEAKAASNGT
jgi:uncharacterized protein involved in exopolysaccharide biosynthesis